MARGPHVARERILCGPQSVQKRPWQILNGRIEQRAYNAGITQSVKIACFAKLLKDRALISSDLSFSSALSFP